ncbi:MAG: hypothetical protein WBR30_02400 [Candidatus Sulfotelmatobacter sp.]
MSGDTQDGKLLKTISEQFRNYDQNDDDDGAPDDAAIEGEAR